MKLCQHQLTTEMHAKKHCIKWLQFEQSITDDLIYSSLIYKLRERMEMVGNSSKKYEHF